MERTKLSARHSLKPAFFLKSQRILKQWPGDWLGSAVWWTKSCIWWGPAGYKTAANYSRKSLQLEGFLRVWRWLCFLSQGIMCKYPESFMLKRKLAMCCIAQCKCWKWLKKGRFGGSVHKFSAISLHTSLRVFNSLETSGWWMVLNAAITEKPAAASVQDRDVWPGIVFLPTNSRK